MNKFLGVLLLSFLLVLPVSADTQKDAAIMAMSQTPLVTMDKDSALLVAAFSYECASYFIGMTVVARQLDELGQLEGAVELEKFTRLNRQIAGYHIAAAEIIHMIHDINEEQDLAIMMEQQKKVEVVLNETSPDDIDARYSLPCRAVLMTYLPILFKEEEKNGA